MPVKISPGTQNRIQQVSKKISEGFQKYWLRMALLGAAAYMAHEKDVSFDIQLNNASAAIIQVADESQAMASTVSYEAKPVNTSQLNQPKARPASQKPAANVSNLANTYSNLTSENKGETNSESTKLKTEKRKKQLRYVKRFADVAQAEMDKYGIPASITLAQGLLESNVGESKLATKNNNHFGIKCFSRSCSKGHCSNFTDDSHKDFFRKYQSSWESYRAHSMLLKRGSRYQKLFKLDHNDYKGWAHGLKKAGYATDKRYAEKIINLIEDLKLYQYDH
ncbi:MAG: glucosaminidase domain-containing protein [Chitinophagales bacterium]|nr:glucosaminidase domain-containing protein [Chitinophagales bacterium]